jgi:ABC-type multidrug transport system fused ATPase/permease subunit
MTVNKDKAEGLKLCFGYLGTVIAMSISYQLKVLWSGKMGARLKQRLAAKISEHALLKGLTSASDKAAAVVLASQDTHNICEGAICLWQLPASICEGSVITALVIETSGALGGGIAAAILIAGFIALFCMSLRMTSLKHEMSCAQDRQVSLFYEVISNIRPFRLYGWDVFFLDRLNKLTEQLAPIQRKIMVLKALNVSTVIIFPCFVSLIVFIVHFTETGMFNSTVFQNTLLSLLNTFRYPLLNLPSSLRSIAAANNSYRRVLEYFRRPIAVDQRAAADEAGAVEIDDLPIGPNGSMLKQLRVKPGSLFVLQGPVKSYKSTVINTLAGHVKIPTTASVRIGGSISYAPQLPWMCQTTIQDNIISSEAFDEKRYEQVLQACALTQDLAIMPLGDQTPVAEKGISLSGGQRQRVALARAAYKNADIYLLDNPISALDDATQEHIWSQLIEGLLKDATVIVSSSRSVPSCSMILHLNPKGLEGDIQQVYFCRVSCCE